MLSKIKRYSLTIVMSFAVLTSTATNALQPLAKSPNDTRDYGHLTLNNGMQVLLISDPAAEKAAAVMRVGIGSFQDPKSRPGLAHFLEHMLFLGTKKYPKAGDYNAYIKAHGGTLNAFTAGASTTYFFSILPEFFDGGLDRFSQFFIAPLFNKEYVDRERNAVESEYRLKIHQDGRRIYNVIRATSNPNHPYSRFSVGTLATLSNQPGHPIREDLMAFYHRHYTSDNMTLILTGPQPLAQLHPLALRHFKAVPRNKPAPAKLPAEPIWRQQELGKQLRIQPLGQYQELMWSFPVPPMATASKHQSLPFVAFLLEQSGKGSMVEQLLSRGWITSLTSHIGNLDQQQGALDISMALTNEGLVHQQEISQILFEYLRYARSNLNQAWLFKEFQQAQTRAFLYPEKADAADYALSISQNLDQGYPLQNILYAPYVTQQTTYDANAVDTLLSKLVPSRGRLHIIASADPAASLMSQVEPWYNVRYDVQPLNPTDVALWQAKPGAVTFKPPLPTPYLPTELALITSTQTQQVTKLLDNQDLRVWYQFNDSFKIPRQTVRWVASTPWQYEAAIDRLALLIFARWANNRLVEEGSHLFLAGADAVVKSVSRGLEFEISGYNSKQPVLFKKLINQMHPRHMTQPQFEVALRGVQRELANFSQGSPVMQVFSATKLFLSRHTDYPPYLQSQLGEVSFTAAKASIMRFFDTMNVEALVCGNVRPAVGETLTQHIVTGFQSAQTAEASREAFVRRFTRLQPGQHQHYTIPVDHNDSVLVKYVQLPSHGARSIVKSMLLASMLQPVYYRTLRTQQQLGYVVGVQALPRRSMAGMLFYIESPTAGARDLEAKSDQCLADFAKSLHAMPADEYARYKSSLQRELELPNQSLSELTDDTWSSIANQFYDFDRRQEYLAQLQDIELAECQAYMDSMISQAATGSIVLFADKAATALTQAALQAAVAEFHATAHYG